jgi:hypothetical protein
MANFVVRKGRAKRGWSLRSVAKEKKRRLPELDWTHQLQVGIEQDQGRGHGGVVFMRRPPQRRPSKFINGIGESTGL